LAVTAARQGVSALLVDADPLAGGIDLVVGCEDSPGLRWPEVTGTSGRVSATALRGALPQVDSLSVLSWDRGSTGCADAGTMRSILTAGQRGARLVVVDLPRRLDEAAAEAAACCNVVLLVCPTEVRSIAGAAGALRVLRESVADIRLVVRHGSRPRADADAVSELLGIPLLGTVPTRRAVVRAIDDGVGIPARAPLAAACRRLLRELDVTGMPP
jgi:secretion/DNA translocation related CpaE-like protein